MMALSENNRKYFNSESDKNRDQWTHSDGDRTIRIQNVKKINPYASMKFDDVIHYKAPTRLWTNADGEEEWENEESVEPENEEAYVEEPFAEEELPKFRHLVRAKKLEYKAQYGKAHAGTRRECKIVSVPSTCYKRVCAFGKCADVAYPCMKNQEVCVNIPTWTWGWRKKWREFKQAGGLAQLKMQSKGMMPPPNTTTTTPTGNPPRGGGRNVGNTEELVKLDPKLDVGNGTSQASMAGNIIGTILIIGVLVGVFKTMK